MLPPADPGHARCPTVKHMRGIAQTLVLTGAVRGTAISALLSEYGETDEFIRQLIARRLVTPTQVGNAVARLTGHRFVDISGMQLESDIVGLLPGALCRKYHVLPISRSGDGVVLAMLDPTDILALDDVATLTDLRVEPVVVASDALQLAFQRFVRSDEELSDLSAELEESAATQLATTASMDEQDGDAPIVRFVNLLVTQAIDDRASDIHVEPGESHLTVRYRIDGVLHEMQRADRNIQDGVISRLKIMASIDIAERRRPQDGRLSVSHNGRRIDLRVATLPTVWGEKIVMRILDATGVSLSLGDLRMGRDNLSLFRSAIGRPHGMVLVTGPTGSGKSTTLYTALREVANPRVNVITVEDPVEYRMPGVNQVQVNAKAGLTFQSALRSILRSDPDIVLVGEIRDRETAIISIEAALTGHLVLSTLHTNDAPGAVARLTEIGAEPYLVATALSAVVAQRLARRLCAACRTAYREDAAVLTRLGIPNDPAEPPTLYHAAGCPACANTGYRGRIGVHEVMAMTEDLEALVVKSTGGGEMRELALAQGMTTLRSDGWAKVLSGLTTIEEVLRVTV